MEMPSKLGIFIGAGCLIASAIGLVNGKTPAKPKEDPCKQYQEKALESMQTAELYLKEEKERRVNLMNAIDANASFSAMNSAYYLVCRDLEKRK